LQSTKVLEAVNNPLDKEESKENKEEEKKEDNLLDQLNHFLETYVDL
jgi:hypothetical protein